MEIEGQFDFLDKIPKQKEVRGFTIDKPIRLIELFAGYGSQSFALDYLGVKYESWKICEWAVKSIQAYKDGHCANDNTDYSADLSKEDIVKYLADKGVSANYNAPMTCAQIERLSESKLRTIYNNIKATNNLVNIQQVKGEDLEIVDTDKYCYVMTYSFPCFTADSLVLTKNGYKRIADICIDDEVLSHDNKFHKVVNRFENGIRDIYKINAMGIDEIKTTYNHKFYIREKYRKGHKAIRCFKEPVWKELKNLTNNDYLGIAINQQNRSIVSNKLPTQEKDFWWIIGRYLGDGWIRQQGGIIICCAKDETYEIISKLENLNWNYNIVNERTVNKIHISKKALSNFVEQFGKGAGNKHLTQDILDLPIFYLKPFIEGYLSADGCFTNGVYKATSISRELIYGIAQCVAKVYKTPYKIYKVEPQKTKLIEDRLVNQNNWYQLVFKTEKRKQDKAFYENGYIWYPIKSIDYIGKDYVYDIEVQDSHSFTVQNTIVHNCQDLSSAGLGKGMKKGSGTRSGMLWEVERILTEIKEYGGDLPQVLLMENVPQVHGKKNMADFERWCQFLSGLGYKNCWKDLNAKDYGIPQSRNRCFMVSTLSQQEYVFPRPIVLEKRLEDLLEENVDEKYYLSDRAIQGIKNTTFNSGKLSASDLQMEVCNKALEFLSPNDVIDYSYSNARLEEIRNGYIKTMNREDNSIMNTLTTSCEHFGVCIKEPRICASRGRNPENPNSRKKGEKLKQRLELGPEGLSNTITTVQKDNYVVEPKTKLKRQLCNKLIEENRVKENDVIRHNYTTSKNGNCVQTNNEAPTLDTRCDCLGVVQNYRIRKLTPRECGRLQGLKDVDIDKIQLNQSNASCYHLYGDSICISVLVAIFSNMLSLDYTKFLDFDNWWKNK